MCFGSRKKSKIIPAGQLSIDKLNTFFTEYVLATHLILLSGLDNGKQRISSFLRRITYKHSYRFINIAKDNVDTSYYYLS